MNDVPLDGERLAGKTAIVTGAGSDEELLGIGGAIARLFARQGAAVVSFDVSGDRAEVTARAIDAAGGRATVCVGDVTSAASCREVVELAEATYGSLDIVVNNAAIIDASGAAGGFDESAWHRVMDINLLGPTLLSETAHDALARSGRGSIVNISSIAGFRGMGARAYASSKAGLMGLTTDLAYRFGRDGIRVNCVAPGHIYTPMGYTGDENRELRRRAGLLGTEGTAWDVAWACVYLASDEARWVTGVLLPVDAGTTTTTPMPMHHFMNQPAGEGR